ncbi:MAG: PilZ domain-containing protein [Nannocystaceae bacterium]
MSIDRRGAPRFACGIDTQLALAGALIESVQTVDLSFSGICVLTPDWVPVRSKVQFRLRVRLAQGCSDGLALTGETVWCTSVPRGYQVGSSFDSDMASVAWRRLDIVLRMVRGERPPS